MCSFSIGRHLLCPNFNVQLFTQNSLITLNTRFYQLRQVTSLRGTFILPRPNGRFSSSHILKKANRLGRDDRVLHIQQPVTTLLIELKDGLLKVAQTT